MDRREEALCRGSEGKGWYTGKKKTGEEYGGGEVQG